jgi:hypothetical protein
LERGEAAGFRRCQSGALVRLPYLKDVIAQEDGYYCSDEYWGCADHYVALTHMAIGKHPYAAGFEPERVIPRYLPYSFRGILPPSP